MLLILTAFLLEEFVGHVYSIGKLPPCKGNAEKLDS